MSCGPLTAADGVPLSQCGTRSFPAPSYSGPPTPLPQQCWQPWHWSTHEAKPAYRETCLKPGPSCSFVSTWAPAFTAFSGGTLEDRKPSRLTGVCPLGHFSQPATLPAELCRRLGVAEEDVLGPGIAPSILLTRKSTDPPETDVTQCHQGRDSLPILEAGDVKTDSQAEAGPSRPSLPAWPFSYVLWAAY